MQPLRAHTRLDMAHFDGATARMQSVPTGVCMSTPALRTGAALDMMRILMGERLLALPRDARTLGGAVCCEHVLSAKGSREAFGRGQSKHAACFSAFVGGRA